jgi:hypothetical protein
MATTASSQVKRILNGAAGPDAAHQLREQLRRLVAEQRMAAARAHRRSASDQTRASDQRRKRKRSS